MSVNLADARVEFGQGFEQIDDDGGKQAWRLHGLSGGLTLPTRPGARFLGLTIAAGAYGDLTPGTCAINGGPPEPFDLSCDHLFFPIDHVSADRLEARFEMEGLGTGELVIREASLLRSPSRFPPE
ncbi:MAG: hypothetical protein NTU53_22070 [Planctomycetota bacterium]|nr:hypothetical protein [Planctomycetota bacterium]